MIYNNCCNILITCTFDIQYSRLTSCFPFTNHRNKDRALWK